MACAVASGLSTALENDGAGGYDLFFDFIGRKSQQFIDRVVKEIFIGSYYFGIVLVDGELTIPLNYILPDGKQQKKTRHLAPLTSNLSCKIQNWQ
jgi:hypothetical protein